MGSISSELGSAGYYGGYVEIWGCLEIVGGWDSKSCMCVELILFLESDVEIVLLPVLKR